MSNDIDYIHLKGLGDPRDGRIAARAGDFGLFQKIFNKHLQTDLALTHMEAAAKLVSERATCLMCFELILQHATAASSPAAWRR